MSNKPTAVAEAARTIIEAGQSFVDSMDGVARSELPGQSIRLFLRAEELIIQGLAEAAAAPPRRRSNRAAPPDPRPVPTAKACPNTSPGWASGPTDPSELPPDLRAEYESLTPEEQRVARGLMRSRPRRAPYGDEERS